MSDATKHGGDSSGSQLDVIKRSRPDPSALMKLLDEWMQGDESEQRDTFEFLRQALDEDRPAGYKLFP